MNFFRVFLCLFVVKKGELFQLVKEFGEGFAGVFFVVGEGCGDLIFVPDFVVFPGGIEASEADEIADGAVLAAVPDPGHDAQLLLLADDFSQRNFFILQFDFLLRFAADFPSGGAQAVACRMNFLDIITASDIEHIDGLQFRGKIIFIQDGILEEASVQIGDFSGSANEIAAFEFFEGGLYGWVEGMGGLSMQEQEECGCKHDQEAEVSRSDADLTEQQDDQEEHAKTSKSEFNNQSVDLQWCKKEGEPVSAAGAGHQ